MSKLALKIIATNKKEKNPHLDLGNCDLTEIPDEVKTLDWVVSLSLCSRWLRFGASGWEPTATKNDGEKNRSLQSLNGLEKLKNLRSLYIGDELDVDLRPISLLPNLECLGISSIKTDNLGFLLPLKKLRSLHIEKMNVVDISPLAFSENLENLAVHAMDNSNLGSISHLTSLRSLYLSDFSNINLSCLKKLKNLETLQLSEFQKKVNVFCHLTNSRKLASIFVSSVNITDWPKFSALKQVEQLIVVNSNMGKLPDLDESHQLKVLLLMGTGTSDLSPIAGLRQLESLHSFNDQISDLHPLSEITSLHSLNFIASQIKDLTPLRKLTKLRSLTISTSEVVDINPIASLYLEQLTLSNCPIDDLTPVREMESLRSLNFANTKVFDLSPLSRLVELDFVDLSQTQVTDLSPLRRLIEAGRQVHFKRVAHRRSGIFVEDCQLRNPPAEIVNQGNDAILNFFDEREGGELDYLYEAKMLILGEGGAGKTSLLRRLYHPDLSLPGEKETTKGIDIHRHEFAMPNGRTFRLNVWDFGGQEIYHSTHQFFLTRRSLYLLIDDTRKDHKSVSDDGFKTWLDMIDLFGEHSPVLIFQNEKGGRSKEIDMAGIKGKYDNVMDRYRGNLELLTAGDKLREGIEFYARNLSHIGETLPAGWIKIRADIEARASLYPHMTQNEYFEIYRNHLPFDKTRALHLSRYLHDLGVFLHFQDDPLLSRTVILQNPWATEAVYRMLDDELVKSKSGRFNQEDCGRVWRESVYCDMHPELLALMENFELCYALTGSESNAWLAPQLLSPIKPSELIGWEQATDLTLRYRYTFMPKGIVGRLMVRLHRFVSDPNRASITTVLFERDTTEVLVQLLPSGNEIEIRARGPERKALMSVVSSELDAVNNYFSGLRDKVGRWAPCHCTECSSQIEPHLFEEKALRKRVEDNRFKVECPKSYIEVDVVTLLDGIRIEQLPAWTNEQKNIPPVQTIRVFLASSNEMFDDRNSFELYVRQLNDTLKYNGIYLEIIRWENFFDALSPTRLQDEYNKVLCDADIFVSLFSTKAGQYTEEEFDAAYERFKIHGKPFIFTYFKDTPTTTSSASRSGLQSLWTFQDKLKSLGHFPTRYEGCEHLKLHFREQLEYLIPKLQSDQ